MLDSSDSQRTEAFIERWSLSGGAERANYQLFLAELCDLIDVPRPDPAKPDNLENGYVFERRKKKSDASLFPSMTKGPKQLPAQEGRLQTCTLGQAP